MWYNNLKRLSGESAGNSVPLGFCRIPFENIVSCPVLRQQNLGGFIRRQILADLWSWHNNLMKAAREKVSRHEKEELQ